MNCILSFAAYRVSDIRWNPSTDSKLLAILSSSGALHLFDYPKSGLKQVAQVKGIQATASECLVLCNIVMATVHKL